jgi:hypothetical protein
MIAIPTPRHLMDKTLEVYARTTGVNNDGTPNVSHASAATACVLRCMLVPNSGGESIVYGGVNARESVRVIADPSPITGSVTHLDAHAKIVYNAKEYDVVGVIRNPADAGCVLAFTMERDA